MQAIYLAGPISGCNDTEANTWRDQIMEELKGQFLFTNPMDRDYRHINLNHLLCFNEAPGIVAADKAGIEACDILLANIPYPSIGTAMEIYFACGLRHHVIVISRPEPAALSPWVVVHADKVVFSLTDALEYLKGIAK